MDFLGLEKLTVIKILYLVTSLSKLRHIPKPSIMRTLYIAVFSLVILTSCRFFGGERIYGSGHVVSQTRNVGSFNGIDISGAIKVHIRQDANSTVKVETDDNLLEYVDVYTDGNTLVIHPKQGYNPKPSRDLIVYISAPSFKNIEVSGASELAGENAISGNSELVINASGASKITLELSGGKIVSDISGASTLNLKGQVSDLDAEASGASDMNCYDLVVDNAKLDLSGASSADITANKSLTAEASGASHIRYKGTASVNQSTSGAGSVSKEG